LYDVGILAGKGDGTFGDFAFTTAIPEPGTWAAALLGLGAPALRRRKTKAN